MNIYDNAKKFVTKQGLQNQEKVRIAVIQYAIAFATLIGLCLELVFRISASGLGVALPVGIVSIFVVLAIALIRRGNLDWSGNILLWTLLGFLFYLICVNDGIHDTAILGIPAVLVGGGLILKRKQFYIFNSVTLVSIALIGYAEMNGPLHIPVSGKTNYLDILDITIILGLTSVTIRLLSDSITGGVIRSRNDELEIKGKVAQLKESEERFRALFEGANDGILIIRDQLFVECNSMALRMFGCEGRSEILGQGPWHFSPIDQPDGRDSKDKALEIIDAALHGSPQRFYWQHSRKNGTMFEAEVSLSRSGFGKETLIQAIIRDVTDRKQMEDRVRESEEYYRKLVNTSPDAIVIVDADGKLSFVSPRAYDMFGVPKDQSILGLPILQWVASEDYEVVNAHLKEFLAGHLKSHAREYRLLRQNRSLFWCEIASSPLNAANGEVKGILMVCRDVSDRKKAEEELRESEERFSRLAGAAFEGIVISENGTVVDLNDQCATMLGYERTEMIGLNVAQFVAKESLELVKNNITMGIEDPYEHSALKKDGLTFPVEVRAKRLPYGGRMFRVTAIRDITERKQAEESLLSSEQKYRNLFESANDAMFIFDPSSELILEANSKACEIYGYSREEFAGLSLKKIAMDSGQGDNVIRQTIETGSVMDFETIHFKKGGVAVHVLVNTSVIDFKGAKAILSISRDITERELADEVLRLQSAAIQSAANAIVITDRTGIITFVNSAFTRMTGYAPEEAIGRSPKILKSREQSAEFYETMWATISARSVWRGELVNKRKDGSHYSEEMTITPVESEQGEITHFIAIKNDVTDRKKLQEQLIQAQRMEAIGTLAGGMAHDFNNILSIILGHLSLIKGSINNASNITYSAETIATAVQRGADLVRQMLTFARRSKVTRQPVDVNELVNDVTRMLQGTFPKTIEILRELDSMLPIILVDRTQLEQAILNLCINAKDAMEDMIGSKFGRGKLTVRTGKISGRRLRARFDDATSSEYVVISILDTGTGIDSVTKEKIFDPFFTTKGEGKGTGLGLAVVYGVVKTHQGFVDVESAIGQGTTFTLYFPSSMSRVRSASSDEVKTIVNLRGSETILVIEDEVGLRELMIEFLGGNGYRALTASDGIKGIDQFEKHKKEIALVLLDMGLPKLDGSEVFAALKHRNPNVKVILASGHLEPEIKTELMQAGAKDFLQKPFAPEEALMKIRKVLDSGE